jgi:hypothetical protein
MNTKDLTIISSVALATATLTVAAFLPNSLNANDDNVPKQITQPKLVSHGVEFTLAAAEHQALKAGDEPAFELKAVNTTAEDIDASVLVSMTSTAPQSKFSRMVVLPAPLWQKTCPMTLKPKETKVIPLVTATKLPQNSTISVTLRAASPQKTGATVQPMPYAVQAPAGIPASAIVALSYSTLEPAQTAKPALN